MWGFLKSLFVEESSSSPDPLELVMDPVPSFHPPVEEPAPKLDHIFLLVKDPRTVTSCCWMTGKGKQRRQCKRRYGYVAMAKYEGGKEKRFDRQVTHEEIYLCGQHAPVAEKQGIIVGMTEKKQPLHQNRNRRRAGSSSLADDVFSELPEWVREEVKSETPSQTPQQPETPVLQQAEQEVVPSSIYDDSNLLGQVR